jgi:NADH-quinone oxidoreductase subunit N
MVRQGGSEASHLSQWAGLGRHHPVFAATFSFLLLAFAGIPLTSGFTAKYAAFAPAVASGAGGALLVVIAVLASAITAFVYVRLIVLMYFTEVPGDDEVVVVLTPSIGSTVAITAGVAATVVLGIVPGFLLEIASNASQFLL